MSSQIPFMWILEFVMRKVNTCTMGWRGDLVSTSIFAFVHLTKWSHTKKHHRTPWDLNDNMKGWVGGFVWDVMERGDWPRGIFQENLQKHGEQVFSYGQYHLVGASFSLSSLLCTVFLNWHFGTATQVNWSPEKSIHFFITSMFNLERYMYVQLSTKCCLTTRYSEVNENSLRGAFKTNFR